MKIASTLVLCTLCGVGVSAAAASPTTTPLDPVAEKAREADPTAIVANTEPGFHPPFRLKADGRTLDIGHYDPTPQLVDWDNDGDKDLLLGVMAAGGAKWYRNTGSDTKPEYASEGWLKVFGGEIAQRPGGG